MVVIGTPYFSPDLDEGLSAAKCSGDNHHDNVSSVSVG